MSLFARFLLLVSLIPYFSLISLFSRLSAWLKVQCTILFSVTVSAVRGATQCVLKCVSLSYDCVNSGIQIISGSCRIKSFQQLMPRS